MTMQAEGGCQTGPLDRYLKPKVKRVPPCMPQAAFRSTNLCQQLLAGQLGWRMPPSMDAWRQVQARTALLQLQLPPVWHSPPGVHQRQEVCCLQLQQAPGSSCSRHSDTRLAAVGYSCGTLHIIKLADMLEAAAADAAAVAAADADAVQDRLVDCCWAAGELPELATAGAQGVTVRRFVEGRHHEYPLRLKGGGQLAKSGQVAYLDKGAAYTLAAAHAGGVVLWDCRVASRAVAELPTASAVQLMQAMPGGTMLLAAAADGQLALYDVRRLSSNANSVINFGGSRASQQLIASFNVPARADEAAAPTDGSSSLIQAAAAGSCAAAPLPDARLGSRSSRGHGVSCRIYPFFRDVLLNPADPNLVAYVRPDLQVGVFDLYHNRVLQQAAARGCWDASGRVLYTHGLLRHRQADCGVAQLQPTLAAVDFGSLSGRQQRRGSSWREQASHSSSSWQQPDPGFVPSSSMLGASGSGVWRVRGGGVMCSGGQVLHLPMADNAAPTELVAACDGQLFAGTLQAVQGYVA
ncbi:hypothetical protein COO60DRAFT_1670907 [Scenedesmus sp. NREL 46B-D3]|nr:hypothetical protein COO60DRAFT_1670907 [Scenedesmus sp. NREL 46B-D3]